MQCSSGSGFKDRSLAANVAKSGPIDEQCPAVDLQRQSKACRAKPSLPRRLGLTSMLHVSSPFRRATLALEMLRCRILLLSNSCMPPPNASGNPRVARFQPVSNVSTPVLHSTPPPFLVSASAPASFSLTTTLSASGNWTFQVSTASANKGRQETNPKAKREAVFFPINVSSRLCYSAPASFFPSLCWSAPLVLLSTLIT